MSTPGPPMADLPFLLMRAQSAVTEHINSRIVAHGHPGLRPVHGLVFARIASAGATVNEIAAHLGVTKQSAAAIVETLEDQGYVTRETIAGAGARVTVTAGGEQFLRAHGR